MVTQVRRFVLVAAALAPLAEAVLVDTQLHHKKPKPDTPAPLKLRRGEETDLLAKKSGFKFVNLTEVLTMVRKSLPGETFGKKPYLMNVGASYKDEDPIYSLDMERNFEPDYVILGYDCSKGKILHEKRPDVTFRSMCVTGPTILADMKEVGVPQKLAMLKTDIDSLDAPVLDAILQEYKPYVVYSEIMWDFPPPIEFGLVKVGGGGFNGRNGGCFGMSMMMAYKILRANGYVLIEAAHANIMAVHQSVAHLFADRPTDPWFWYQTVKDGFYHTHWMGGGHNAIKNSPLALLSESLGLYERTSNGQHKIDSTMARLHERIKAGCEMSGGDKWVLAIGDRCCAPEWGNMTGHCVCNFLERDDGQGLRKE